MSSTSPINTYAAAIQSQTARILTLSVLSGILACAQIAQPVVVGYYQESSSFPLSKLTSNGSAAHLTHLNYAFADIRYDYTCAPHDPAGAGPNGVFQQLKTLKAANPNLKVLISIGGQAGSYNFVNAANDGNRTAFVKSCIAQFIDGQFATPNIPGIFDGIDIDWEFPLAAADAANYNLLLQEFRLQLDTYQQGHPSVRQRLLLTSAISPQNGPDKLQNIQFSGATGAAAYVDFFNVMTYDYAGTWNENTSSTAPLSLISSNISDLITLSHVPPSQMVLGIPFYGVHYTGSFWGDTAGTPLNVLLSQSSIAPVTTPAGTVDTDYAAIAKNILNSQNVNVYHDADSSAWVFDPANSLLWAFDDQATIAAKGAYARNSGLAGIMTWDISKDTDNGALLCAMETAMSGGSVNVCNAAPTTPVTKPPYQGTLLYDFENNSQGWTRTSGVFSVYNSTDTANSGSNSLAVNFVSAGQTYQPHGTVYVVPPAAVHAGATIDFHIWVPAASLPHLTNIMPFFMDANWTWTNSTLSLTTLTPDAWNTVSLQIPANAVAPFTELGVQFDSKNLWNGLVYIDSVSVR